MIDWNLKYVRDPYPLPVFSYFALFRTSPTSERVVRVGLEINISTRRHIVRMHPRGSLRNYCCVYKPQLTNSTRPAHNVYEQVFSKLKTLLFSLAQTTSVFYL